jgi:hypothetical protein
MARAQQRPKLPGSGVEEMSHERIETIPEHRDDEPSTKSLGTISASKYDESHIYQRLEEV